MTWWVYIERAGSIASILALILGIHIFAREIRMAREVHALKHEEETWHKEKHDAVVS